MLESELEWNWKKDTFDGVTYRYSFMPPMMPGKAVFLLLHGFPNGQLIKRERQYEL